MKIILTPDQDVTEIFKEAITILNNMRRWQKEWEQEYGCELKRSKKLWEKRADEYLKKLGATSHMERLEKINIEQS
jgi:ABC-type microcin C transport system duplicated ATPase subunit YejF